MTVSLVAFFLLPFACSKNVILVVTIVAELTSKSTDGPYVHASTQVSTIRGYDNPASLPYNNPFPEGVYWADIDGDGSKQAPFSNHAPLPCL